MTFRSQITRGIILGIQQFNYVKTHPGVVNKCSVVSDKSRIYITVTLQVCTTGNKNIV